MRKILITVCIVLLASSITIPTNSSATEVHDILLSKDDYVVNSTAYAVAALNFSGSAGKLENVSFAWFKPDFSVAKIEKAQPEANGLAASSAIVDMIGDWWVNATYEGNLSIYNNRSFKVFNDSWSGTTYIDDWVFIGQGIILTIDTNSEVRFDKDGGLRVQGKLIANDVLFTSNSSSPGPGNWTSIIFESSSDSSSIFQNNTVEYADKGLIIYIVPLDISNNTFRYNMEGIRLFSSPSLLKMNNFSYNAEAVKLYGSPAVFENSTLDNNSYAMILEINSDVYLRNVTVKDTFQTAITIWDSKIEMIESMIYAGAGTGIYFTDKSSGTVEDSQVSGFSDGISVLDSSTVTIIDSDISLNDVRNIRIDNARATAINYSTKAKISVMNEGLLTIANYLTVAVNLNNGSNVANAVVSLYNDEQFADYAWTNEEGITPPMLVIDRTYTSSGIIENNTMVEVYSPDIAFVNNFRLVDMSSSHTEFFTGSLDDNDGDGIPDLSDIDDDNDDLWDVVEQGLGSDPLNPDSDGDGLSDGIEHNLLGSDPLVVDTDGDGYTDWHEYVENTVPFNPYDYPEPVVKPKPDEDKDDVIYYDLLIIILALEAFAIIISIIYFIGIRKRGKR